MSQLQGLIDPATATVAVPSSSDKLSAVFNKLKVRAIRFTNLPGIKVEDMMDMLNSQGIPALAGAYAQLNGQKCMGVMDIAIAASQRTACATTICAADGVICNIHMSQQPAQPLSSMARFAEAQRRAQMQFMQWTAGTATAAAAAAAAAGTHDAAHRTAAAAAAAATATLKW
ncbi:hypothetical protein OEZ86_011935 [Tetradesmus obliquus]|nr:hypothetical protein OEZ86_011935 [Tetradesmus obliquus]